eukprot:gene6397-4610_t
MGGMKSRPVPRQAKTWPRSWPCFGRCVAAVGDEGECVSDGGVE